MRHGGKSRNRGHIDNRTAAARDHAGQRRPAQAQRSRDVQVQHAHLPLDVALGEVTGGAVAGIVHQVVQVRQSLDERDHPLHTLRAAQVSRQRLNRHGICRADFFGDRRKARLAAPDQRQVHSLRGQLPGKLCANPAGRPGNQCITFDHWHRLIKTTTETQRALRRKIEKEGWKCDRIVGDCIFKIYFSSFS